MKFFEFCKRNFNVKIENQLHFLALECIAFIQYIASKSIAAVNLGDTMRAINREVALRLISIQTIIMPLKLPDQQSSSACTRYLS